MGCATSKNEDKCNKDVCERRKIDRERSEGAKPTRRPTSTTSTLS